MPMPRWFGKIHPAGKTTTTTPAQDSPRRHFSSPERDRAASNFAFLHAEGVSPAPEPPGGVALRGTNLQPRVDASGNSNASSVGKTGGAPQLPRPESRDGVGSRQGLRLPWPNPSDIPPPIPRSLSNSSNSETGSVPGIPRPLPAPDPSPMVSSGVGEATAPEFDRTPPSATAENEVNKGIVSGTEKFRSVSVPQPESLPLARKGHHRRTKSSDPLIEGHRMSALFGMSFAQFQNDPIPPQQFVAARKPVAAQDDASRSSTNPRFPNAVGSQDSFPNSPSYRRKPPSELSGELQYNVDQPREMASQPRSASPPLPSVSPKMSLNPVAAGMASPRSLASVSPMRQRRMAFTSYHSLPGSPAHVLPSKTSSNRSDRSNEHSRSSVLTPIARAMSASVEEGKISKAVALPLPPLSSTHYSTHSSTPTSSQSSSSPISSFVPSPLLSQSGGNSALSRINPSPLSVEPLPSKLSSKAPKMGNWKKYEPPLGSGSFGVVYKGFNKENGALFAVKEVPLSGGNFMQKESLRQLKQEIALMSQLQHSNIVQYFGTDMDDKNLYIFLEYMPGGSIHKLLNECGKFPLPLLRTYTRHIVAGLAYLHNKKTVHRDIKGANLLVDTNGQVKLADFGMAKHMKMEDFTKSYEKGSSYWMAPEVLIPSDQGYDLAVDIWSLGCTVLEMATGKPPWWPLQGFQAMFKIANSKELPPIPDDLAPEAKDFVTRCLQRNPFARPSAEKLLDHPFIRNDGVSSPPEIPIPVSVKEFPPSSINPPNEDMRTKYSDGESSPDEEQEKDSLIGRENHEAVVGKDPAVKQIKVRPQQQQQQQQQQQPLFLENPINHLKSPKWKSQQQQSFSDSSTTPMSIHELNSLQGQKSQQAFYDNAMNHYRNNPAFEVQQSQQSLPMHSQSISSQFPSQQSLSEMVSSQSRQLSFEPQMQLSSDSPSQERRTQHYELPHPHQVYSRMYGSNLGMNGRQTQQTNASSYNQTNYAFDSHHHSPFQNTFDHQRRNQSINSHPQSSQVESFPAHGSGYEILKQDAYPQQMSHSLSHAMHDSSSNTYFSHSSPPISPFTSSINLISTLPNSSTQYAGMPPLQESGNSNFYNNSNSPVFHSSSSNQIHVNPPHQVHQSEFNSFGGISDGSHLSSSSIPSTDAMHSISSTKSSCLISHKSLPANFHVDDLLPGTETRDDRVNERCSQTSDFTFQPHPSTTENYAHLDFFRSKSTSVVNEPGGVQTFRTRNRTPTSSSPCISNDDEEDDEDDDDDAVSVSDDGSGGSGSSEESSDTDECEPNLEVRNNQGASLNHSPNLVHPRQFGEEQEREGREGTQIGGEKDEEEIDILGIAVGRLKLGAGSVYDEQGSNLLWKSKES